MNIAERYAEFKRNQLRGRILYLINRETGLTEFAVKEHVGRMLDFSSNPALRGVGLSQEVGTDEDITAAIQYLCENGWINKGNSLSLTASGRAQLNKYMHRSRPYHQFQH
jgi:hypothetical protein